MICIDSVHIHSIECINSIDIHRIWYDWKVLILSFPKLFLVENLLNIKKIMDRNVCIYILFLLQAPVLTILIYKAFNVLCALINSVDIHNTHCIAYFDPYTIAVFTNAQDWHYCHYWQLCIPIYLQFSSLFTLIYVSKCEIRWDWV